MAPRPLSALQPLTGQRQPSTRKRLPARAGRLATGLLVGMIRAYQLVLSPWLGANCRYLPTCSSYAREAIERFGPLRGSWLAVRRIGRCRPGGGSGYDPVPERKDSV